MVLVAGIAACGGGNTALTPPPFAPTDPRLPAASATGCIYPSTQAQTVALPSAGGVTGSFAVGAFPAASTTCIGVTLSTGSDASALSAARRLAAVLSSNRRTLANNQPQPLLTETVNNAFTNGVVITGAELQLPSNLNFPNGRYQAVLTQTTLGETGLLFVAVGGKLTLISTGGPLIFGPGSTATIALYPLGVTPPETGASPSPSPSVSPASSPTGSAFPSGSPTASAVPSGSPTPSAAATTLLNVGGFMYSSGQIVSETVTVSEPPFPPRVPSGPITVNKEFINNATGSDVDYKETFSIPANELFGQVPAGNTGYAGPQYTDDNGMNQYAPGTYSGTFSTGAFTAQNATLTITPPGLGAAFDNCGPAASSQCQIGLFFPDPGTEDNFKMAFNRYLAAVQSNTPFPAPSSLQRAAGSSDR